MNTSRAISICALAVALALAIGAIRPSEPYASASPSTVYIFATQAASPTPALPTPALAPQVELSQVEQPQVELSQVEQPQVELSQVEQPAPAAYVYQSEPLHDLSLDAGATPACDPGIESSYCTLPISTPAPAPAPAYEPMTEAQRQYSEARTR